MKITLNKDHFNYKAGEEIEVTAGQAHYFKMMGMVQDDKPEPKDKPVKKKDK